MTITRPAEREIFIIGESWKYSLFKKIHFTSLMRSQSFVHTSTYPIKYSRSTVSILPIPLLSSSCCLYGVMFYPCFNRKFSIPRFHLPSTPSCPSEHAVKSEDKVSWGSFERKLNLNIPWIRRQNLLSWGNLSFINFNFVSQIKRKTRVVLPSIKYFSRSHSFFIHWLMEK